MAWFKVDDGMPDHRKVRRLGRDKVPAVGLWTLCGAWSSRNLLDGFVPTEVVAGLDPRLKLAARLVEVGLWIVDEVDGEQGYRFHDWADRNPLRTDVEARRRDTRGRVSAHRQRKRGDDDPPPDDDGGGYHDGETDPYDSSNDRGNALHGGPVTGPVTDRYSRAGAPAGSRAPARAAAARPGPARPDQEGTAAQPPQRAAARRGGGRGDHPTPAELDATATSAAGYRILADWARANPGLLSSRRRDLARAVDQLLAQGADPTLLPAALDLAHQPRWKSPVAALPHTYDDARRARHTASGAGLGERAPQGTSSSRANAILALRTGGGAS